MPEKAMWMKLKNFFQPLSLLQRYLLGSLVILVGGMIGPGEGWEHAAISLRE
jgi:hypothetical protein